MLVQTSVSNLPFCEMADGIVTSSPYYRQRVYSIHDLVWGGDKSCTHFWCSYTLKGQSGGKSKMLNVKGEENFQEFPDQIQHYCRYCDAWKGQLGQEPDPELFVKHMGEIGDEFKRVLKPNGVFLLNISDTYAGSGGTGNQYKQKYSKMKKTGPTGIPNGLKPKDIIGIPWRVAMEYQRRGWWWRGWMPWIKPGGLPDSTKDRPGRNMEIIHIFSKSPTYYFGMDEACEFLGIDRQLRSGDLIALLINISQNKKKHFAPWPEVLAEFLIRLSVPHGGLVFDPFSGSGTTCEVAQRIGRRFIGTDLSLEYLKMTNTGVNEVQGSKKVTQGKLI